MSPTFVLSISISTLSWVGFRCCSVMPMCFTHSSNPQSNKNALGTKSLSLVSNCCSQQLMGCQSSAETLLFSHKDGGLKLSVLGNAFGAQNSFWVAVMAKWAGRFASRFFLRNSNSTCYTHHPTTISRSSTHTRQNHFDARPQSFNF